MAHSTTIQALSVLLPVGYVLAALLHGAAFAGARSERVARLRVACLRATLLVHALLFFARGHVSGQFPIVDLWSTISAIAFSTALFYALVAREARHAGSGGIALGLVFVAQLAASSFGPFVPAVSHAGAGWFRTVHVATSVVASSAMVLSGLHGVLYLLLLQQMRARRFGALFGHLPDLDVCARMMRSAALVGFIGLTIGLNLGIALAHIESSPRFGYLHPEVLLSLVIWLYFGGIAFSQRIRGFGERRASLAAAGGLVVVCVSVVLAFLPNSFHAGL